MKKGAKNFFTPSRLLGRGFFCPDHSLNSHRKYIMSKDSGFMKALKCRECGREYPLEATHVCEFDFGPLEVAYDYEKIKKRLLFRVFTLRAVVLWR